MGRNPGKLLLVGMVLVVSRGTVTQLALANILSFGFLLLQMKMWPYKHEQDNILRACVASPRAIYHGGPILH